MNRLLDAVPVIGFAAALLFGLFTIYQGYGIRGVLTATLGVILAVTIVGGGISLVGRARVSAREWLRRRRK